MKKIIIVARYTFSEAVKSKILLNIIFLGIAFLLSSYIASELTFGTPEKTSLDIGLGLTSIAIKIIAIFYGVNIIQSEIENRSIYLVLSRPITKVQYLMGRLMGMSGILFVNVFILGLISLSLYYFLGGTIDSMMIWTIFFSFIEALLLLLIVVTCSLFSSKVLSILLGISAYISGYISSTLLESNQFAKTGIFNFVLKFLNNTIPNFSRLNLKDFILYEQSISSYVLIGTLLHSSLFILIYLILGSILMKRKSLD